MQGLRDAVLRSDVKSIISYKRGVNINSICVNGMTLLGVAAETGNLSVLKALIEHHSSLALQTSDLSNENYCKPKVLQIDADGNKRYKNIGYFEVCRDADENEFGDGPTPDGMEALEWDMEVNETQYAQDDNAVDDQDVNLYKWYANILNKTSIILDSPERDITRFDMLGRTVLHHAVQSGNIEMVDYLIRISSKELHVNLPDSCGFSPLHTAVEMRDIEMVSWLVRNGANVNVVEEKLRQSPLHLAISKGDLDIAKILIEAGADVNLLDIKDRSVLMMAVRMGHVESVRYLIKCRALVNLEAYRGVTALRLAIWENNATLVRILLESGARIIHSHFLLHAAVSSNNFEIVQLMLQSGCWINAKNDQGKTPLMLACSRKNLPIVKYLLSHGADVNACSDFEGKTALHVCVQDVREAKSVRQLVELLVQHGANLDAISYQGSVLFYSIILENRSAATALIQHGADVNLHDERSYVDNLSLAKRHGDLDLVKLLVYAGFRLDQMMSDPQALRTRAVDPACDFLIYTKRNPLNMRELCRIVIRKQLGTKELMANISKLPLPTLLQKYLALDIL